MLLNFEKSGLQTFPTKLKSLSHCSPPCIFQPSVVCWQHAYRTHYILMTQTNLLMYIIFQTWPGNINSLRVCHIASYPLVSASHLLFTHHILITYANLLMHKILQTWTMEEQVMSTFHHYVLAGSNCNGNGGPKDHIPYCLRGQILIARNSLHGVQPWIDNGINTFTAFCHGRCLSIAALGKKVRWNFSFVRSN